VAGGGLPRLLPSTGITRLHRWYKPLCNPPQSSSTDRAALAELAFRSRHRPTGNRDPLAQRGIPPLLAMEVPIQEVRPTNLYKNRGNEYDSSEKYRRCRWAPAIWEMPDKGETEMSKLKARSVVAAVVVSMASTAWAGGDKDIVDTAIAAGSFKTLVSAVAKAGLVETLKGPGPFTVFAPTDEAFAKLPEGTLESLLKPENKQKLIEILTFHVVAGRVTAADAQGLPVADTVQGTSLLIATTSTGVTVDGATVVKADIMATNGVIHVIDRVLLPKDIVETARLAGQFTTLLAAVEAADLVDALKKSDDLLQSANRDRLAAILKYHVLPTRLLLTQDGVKTLQGGTVQIRPVGAVKVEQANVVAADIKATNGVIHVIDSVLIPALPEPTNRRRAMSVIELAIERGVPLFNAGETDACAAIYEITARSLLNGHQDAFTEADRARLKKALEDMHNDHGSRAQAWTLRYALDDVYRSLRSREQE
jgi:uncharacterized surface protein with fasciclin (FAS1) repeats